jgi:hypothetical protein
MVFIIGFIGELIDSLISNIIEDTIGFTNFYISIVVLIVMFHFCSGLYRIIKIKRWRIFAEKYNLKFEKINKGNANIKGRYKNHKIHICLKGHRKRDFSLTVFLNTPFDFCFFISQFARVGSDRWEVVKIGDPNFDDKYIIETDDFHKLSNLLSPVIKNEFSKPNKKSSIDSFQHEQINIRAKFISKEEDFLKVLDAGELFCDLIDGKRTDILTPPPELSQPPLDDIKI